MRPGNLLSTEISRAVTVIVPAHNEARSIGRSLTQLLGRGMDEHYEVIVACNGCTDDTVSRARNHTPAARVVVIEQASKQAALDAAHGAARFPYRAWIDADVQIGRDAVLKLIEALGAGVHLAAPTRQVELSRSSWVVRAYYEVWERLPQVKEGAFGRGAIVMSPEGYERVRALPRTMSDDLAASEAFAPKERVIVPSAVVRIEGPRNVGDLIRRRVRIATGNAQADELKTRAPGARTSLKDLAGIALGGPLMPLNVAVFALITLISRVRARRAIQSGDFSTWLRDESSRA